MPRSSKRAADAALAATSKFRRSDLWNGFVQGDAVKIAGIRGGHWRFRCHVENLETGASWIEVAELDLPRGTVVPPTAGRAPDSSTGEDGESRHLPVRRVRAFDEERVLQLRAPRRRTAEPKHSVDRGPSAPLALPGKAVQLSLAGLLEGSDLTAGES
jgi:hypothetical protein